MVACMGATKLRMARAYLTIIWIRDGWLIVMVGAWWAFQLALAFAGAEWFSTAVITAGTATIGALLMKLWIHIRKRRSA